jgi:hypothetical protein
VCLIVLLSWHEEQITASVIKKITGIYFITIAPFSRNLTPHPESVLH